MAFGRRNAQSQKKPMKKVLLMLCVITLLAPVIWMQTGAQRQDQTKPRGEPPTNVDPPQALLDRLGLKKMTPEEMERARNRPVIPPPDTPERQKDRLREKIAKDGDFPEEWASLSDREIELKIYELTRDDGKPPAGWEDAPKLIYARRGAVPDEWRVELAYRIKKRQFKETVEGLVRDYGGTIMSEMDLTPFYRGFWIKIAEDGAKRISEDPRVRRVWQNGVAEAIVKE